MPYSKVGHVVGASAIISTARSISAINAAAAVSLRSAYHSRAARASTTASGWSSISVGIRAAQDLSTSLGPGDGLDLARVEFFQAPVLRGGALSSQVSWVKSLTVTGCEPNRSLDFETKDLYNGLSVASESVSFRLFPEGAGTVLVMTSKRSAHMPGPFHVIMLATEFVQGLASRLFISWLLRRFPGLRSNAQLSRIKREVERQ